MLTEEPGGPVRVPVAAGRRRSLAGRHVEDVPVVGGRLVAA